MRKIEITDGLRVNFPGRNDDFKDGVEIGLLAASLANDPTQTTHCVSVSNVLQAERFAEALGYHMLQAKVHDRWSILTFRKGRPRPKLRLVSST